MRRLFSWQLSVLLFLAMAAGARENSDLNSPSPDNPPDRTIPAGDSAPATTPTTSTPSVTVTGKVPGAGPPLPKLAPDQFTECYGAYSTNPEGLDFVAMETCQAKLARDTRVVIDKCINRDGNSSPPMAVQACTELLDRKILDGRERFYLFVNRAKAFLAEGDKQHTLDDYNAAVKMAPKNAQPYYYRGVFYATQKDFSDALADFSEALRLQPKTAALWSERGYVFILQRDYQSAVKDEAEAIRLDPKLARAYFLRGAAFGDLGNSPDAVSDLVTAVSLDPTLDRYVSTKGKSASIALPPL